MVFSYITFMGLAYWRGGELFLPILLTLAFFILVMVCVYMMCLSKATRWKRNGKIGQTFFGLIVLLAFIGAAFPFTNFLRVIEDSEGISQKVSSACDAAKDLDSAYAKYANERLESFKSNLALIAKGKNINPSLYQECLGGASGATDTEKIAGLEKSLKNKLLPGEMMTIVQERHEWLNSARYASVWNPLTPSNIRKIDEQVNGWMDNYKDISSVTYKGEDAKAFVYDEFSSQLSQLTETYRIFHRPKFFALIISLLCFVIMLLPYFVTEKDVAGNISGKELYE